MKVVIQRVNRASVVVEGQVIGSIHLGVLLLIGFGKTDIQSKLPPIVSKIINMRIFPDNEGKFHHSLLEVKGAVLAVPQFTLYADTTKGRRPEFFEALAPNKATVLFDEIIKEFKTQGVLSVQSGRFGAHMLVDLQNDGPVTIILES